MAIKSFSIDTELLSRNKNARLGSGFWEVFRGEYRESSNHSFLKHIAVIKKGDAITEDKIIRGDVPVIAGGKTSPYSHSKSNYSKNIITVSATGDAGYVWYHDYRIWASDCSVVFSKDETEFLTKFIFYYLRANQQKLYALRHGKSQQHVLVEDLERVKIPNTDYAVQKRIIEKATPIEKKIKGIKNKITEKEKLIDSAFMSELKIREKYLEAVSNKTMFYTDTLSIAKSNIRATAIQNSPPVEFIKDALKENTFYLKSILLSEIRRGVQPSYSLDGVKVIKTLNIQDGEVTFSDVDFVNKKFLTKNAEKAKVVCGDLLLTSTGEGRGKAALYEGEEVCLADTHVSIIQVDKKLIEKDFLNYYFQSFLGRWQLKHLERHVKGPVEIYGEDLVNFRIVNFPRKKQREIAKKISRSLEAQKKHYDAINSLNKKIDDIINTELSI